jgi:hypothetical protein
MLGSVSALVFLAVVTAAIFILAVAFDSNRGEDPWS